MALERLQLNVPLAPLTTLGVGGPARWLLPWQDAAELREGLVFAAQRGVPWWLLGGGSNVIVADAGLPGLVLQPMGREVTFGQPRDGAVPIAADAGVVWDTLVAQTVARGLAGLECLSGIPGLVGSAPIQNIGAYGQEVADVIEAVEVLDTTSGAQSEWTRAQCAFGYRDSAWKRTPGRWIVTRVRLRLRENGAPCLGYAQVAQALHGVPVSLAAVREAVLRLRRAKGMVVDPADPDSRSVGSFFINPIVSPAQADALRARFPSENAMPAWPSGGQVKLSAAWLIEHSGIGRGFGVGRVGLSGKHTLALVNRGGATASDVLAFADEVVERVLAASSIRLQREPMLLGF